MASQPGPDAPTEDAHIDSQDRHSTPLDDEGDADKALPTDTPAESEKQNELKPVVSNPGPPPNGGLQAWLQVAGGFMLFFNTWGILNTFGVYQTYYESGELFRVSSSNISWIGSIQSFCLLMAGIVTGPLYDRGYLRILLITGTFLIVFGHMMLSLCHEYWQAMLAQGIVVGVGGGCLFIPALAILPTYFTTKVGMAIGLAASGSSMGGIIYPIVFYRLLPQVGFPWAVRVLGFMVLGTQILPILVMHQRLKPAKARAMIDVTAFTDLHYMIFVGGAILGFYSLYVGIFYLSYFGESTRITDESLSFYLVPILNTASVFGRTLPNILADKIGPFNVIAPGVMILSIMLFSMLAVKTAAALIVEVVFFGFFSGVLIALPGVCFVALTKDKSKIGTRIGQGMGMLGIGVLAGAPGGGGILQHNPGSLDWTGTWIFAGAGALAASVVFSILRIMRAGFKLTKC